MSSDLEKVVSRLETVASRLENLPHLSGGDMKSVKPNTNNTILNEYEKLINSELRHFIKLSNDIGGDVSAQASLVEKAFSAQLEFLKKVISSTKPTDSVFQNLLKPTSDAIGNITNFRETHRRSDYFNHLSSVSEGISFLGWVGVSPAPCPFIKEMQDASQFYTNRVIKDFKEKNANHVEWAKAWMAIFVELQSFVKKNYTTGLTWNSQGTPLKATCVAPPPPPPPMAPKPSSDSSGADSHAALFCEINKGSAVTSGLKKVTDDMKTHKNPNLRAGSTVPAKATDSAKLEHSTKSVVSKPPEMKLEGSKWTVQHFHNKKDIVLKDTAIKQTLYIFKCDNCIITVKGKINSIVMDNCTKSALVFDGLISALDIVNCKSVQAQTLGVLPTVNIDKTDGAQVFLSKESIGAEIVSAKSSEMNVVITKDDGEQVEMALPEQFKTKILNGKLVTTCAEDF